MLHSTHLSDALSFHALCPTPPLPPPSMRVPPMLGPHVGQPIYVSLVVYSEFDPGRRQKLSLIYHLVSNQKLHVSCSHVNLRSFSSYGTLSRSLKVPLFGSVYPSPSFHSLCSRELISITSFRELPLVP